MLRCLVFAVLFAEAAYAAPPTGPGPIAVECDDWAYTFCADYDRCPTSTVAYTIVPFAWKKATTSKSQFEALVATAQKLAGNIFNCRVTMHWSIISLKFFWLAELQDRKTGTFFGAFAAQFGSPIEAKTAIDFVAKAMPNAPLE